MKSTINFSAGGADLILAIEYDFEPGQKETPPSYASGGEPAFGPSVSINSVVLAEVDEDSVDPPSPRICEIIAALCWELRPKEITQATYEAHEHDDDGPDPDMLREARLERQIDRFDARDAGDDL